MSGRANPATEPSEETEDFLEWLRGPDGGGSHVRPSHVLDWAENELHPEYGGPEFWYVVLQEWSKFDLMPHDRFEALFETFEQARPKCRLTEPKTVYRGQDASLPKGLSWTFDRKVAESFARGHRGMYNPNPIVHEMIVTPDQVAFVCNDREEGEVVLKKIPD